MGYEVYLHTDSIGSDSKEARGEYVAIPWQKGGVLAWSKGEEII